MKLKFARVQSAFTLVELLIVITLLGIIATIVISAINPIEQANRASDAGLKADASELLSALQRYYASHNAYPWMAASCTVNGGSFCNPSNGADAQVDWLSADDPSIGLCGGANCRNAANQGELVASLELQTQFLSKSWVNPATRTPPYELLVGKGPSASDAIYVCWTPKSSSNRQVLITSESTNANKEVDTTSNYWSASGAPRGGTCTTTAGAGWGTGACEECLPE